VAIFVGALGVVVATHDTGVVKNDIARNVYVPKELTMLLQVKADYGRHLLPLPVAYRAALNLSRRAQLRGR
jgi:hypothetical protein